MYCNRPHVRGLLLALIAAVPAVSLAGTYDLTWNTIDGGGGGSTGGAYAVSGTIGQPDAQVPPIMSGGTYQLSGGFWAGVGSACSLPGDLNLDGHVDGDDVQPFVNCLIAGIGNCTCGDLNGGGLSASDVPAFVAALLAG